MKRSRISQRLEGVRKVLKSNDTAVVGLGEESKVHEVETSRIMSSEASHYILVKGADIESQDEEDDSQSQTSSLDVGTSTGGTGGTYTAAREDIEYEVQKFFRDRKESLAEDGDEVPKNGLATVEKRAAAIMVESESSGKEEKEEPQTGKGDQEKAVVEEGASELLTKDDMAAQVVDQDEKELTPIIDIMENAGSDPSSSLSKQTLTGEVAVTGENVHAQGQLSHDSTSKGESKSLTSSTTTSNNEILSTQTTINLTTSTGKENTEEAKQDLPSFVNAAAQEETVESDSLIHMDLASKEKSGEAFPSIIAIDLTSTHTTQEERPESITASPPKQTTTSNTELDLLPPTQGSVAAATAEEVALIESDEGGSPSPPAAGWSRGKEVEALLTVAPSEAQEQLGMEVEQLERERTKQSRAAATVSNQMYKEAQVHCSTHLYQ